MRVMFEDADKVIETHVSWVYLVGGKAYKQRKPVRTPFLDFSTVEGRRCAAEEEVHLGRRLAPDVYLGVEERPGPEPVVVMRRMPAARQLSTLVRAGADVHDGLRDVARHVAALHLGSARSADVDRVASAKANLDRWEANHAEMGPYRSLLADPAAGDRAVALARRYVAGRGRLFAERIAAGRAVDGYGDLMSDDIFLLDDGARILDPIEFDPALRAGDGLADIAFLAMDLERLGHPELAAQLFGWYAEFAADRWAASLAHFYIAYRAQVRAKVACIRAAQTGLTRAPEADELLRLSVEHLEAGQVSLVLVGGPPATGKTSIARELGSEHRWVVLRSDEVRKELAGIPSTQSAAAPLMAGVYAPAMTSLTYGALLHRARELLERGESVVLDATWADPTWRAEARRIAGVASAELVELRCDAPLAVASDRAAHRSRDASDAGPEVAIDLAEHFAPWPESVVINTGGPPARAMRLALVATGTDPERSEGLGHTAGGSSHTVGTPT
jgi:aminoglycoside phosphotransferase family enzyme/predicted kinase